MDGDVLRCLVTAFFFAFWRVRQQWTSVVARKIHLSLVREHPAVMPQRQVPGDWAPFRWAHGYLGMKSFRLCGR
jgi:hypothetical protein